MYSRNLFPLAPLLSHTITEHCPIQHFCGTGRQQNEWLCKLFVFLCEPFITKIKTVHSFHSCVYCLYLFISLRLSLSLPPIHSLHRCSFSLFLVPLSQLQTPPPQCRCCGAGRYGGLRNTCCYQVPVWLWVIMGLSLSLILLMLLLSLVECILEERAASAERKSQFLLFLPWSQGAPDN